MEPARRTDWKIEAMPDATVRVDVEATYTHAEFARLRFGVVPRSMDEKWFIFFEDPWLHCHRSWTGDCIYQVRFEPAENGARIAEAIVNGRERPAGADAAAEAGLLRYLLATVLERNARFR